MKNKIGHSSRSSSIQRSKTTKEVSGTVKHFWVITKDKETDGQKEKKKKGKKEKRKKRKKRKKEEKKENKKKKKIRKKRK